MNQDKAIFMSQCSALTHKNNEILVLILPFKSAYYLFLVPWIKKTNWQKKLKDRQRFKTLCYLHVINIKHDMKYVFDGFNHQEIATELGIRESTQLLDVMSERVMGARQKKRNAVFLVVYRAAFWFDWWFDLVWFIKFKRFGIECRSQNGNIRNEI